MKMFSLALAVLMIISMFCAACGNADSGKTTAANQTTSEGKTDAPKVDVKDVKIAMMIWDNGPQQTATQNYCKALEENIDGLTFVYGQLDAQNEGANVAACEAMIAQGCNGIILYNQTTGLPTIAKTCKEAGVYFGVYLGMPSSDMLPELEENEFYIGSVMDGPIDTSALGIYAAQMVIDNGYKHVGCVSFPLDIIEPMKVMVDAFYKTIDDFNATASADKKIELYDNEEVFFEPVKAAYFANHTEMDAVFGPGGGVKSVYPTLVQAGLAGKIKLISAGMEYDDDTIGAIEKGDIVLATTSSIEQLVYPVAMIFNSVQGQKYSDQPSTSESVGCGMLYIKNADDIKTIKEKSYLYATSFNQYDRLMLKPEDAKKYLVSYNSGATYKELTTFLDSLTMDTLSAK